MDRAQQRNSTDVAGQPGRGIVLTRELDAPRSQVFQAWTDPDRFAAWWGPDGFTTPACTIDPRPGGVLHYCMRSPEGQDFWGKGVYREVVEPGRIVYVDSFADADGNLVEPARYGMSPGWPAEALVTLTLAERIPVGLHPRERRAPFVAPARAPSDRRPSDGGTHLTLEHAVEAAPESERDMCQQGWSQTLDRLADYLAGLPMAAGARSAALARQFEARARDAEALLEGLGPADWRKVTSAEKWTVGATAHHLAGALGAVAGMVTAIAAGQSIGHLTTAMLDEMNASHAREHARCDQGETIALFRSGAASASAAVRGLTDERLDRSGTVFADMPPMTVEQLVVRGLVNHVDEHIESIRKTIGR